MTELLEYREFPIQKAAAIACFGPAFAFLTLLIVRLTRGELFQGVSAGDHLLLLGLGAAAASLGTVVLGLVFSRVRNLYMVMALSAIGTPALSLVLSFVEVPPGYAWTAHVAYVGSCFVFLTLTLGSMSILLNEIVVIRYRARIAMISMLVMLFLSFVYVLLATMSIDVMSTELPIAQTVAIVGVLLATAVRPWRWERHPLTVSEDVQRFFVPTFFVLASFMLWYFSTQMNIRNMFAIVGEEFTTLGEYSGLSVYEPLMLAAGAVVGGLLADVKGRKTAFNSVVLMVGLLAIFGTTMYGIETHEISPGTYEPVVVLNAVPLLLAERFVEGFMLVLLVVLIWSEVGSPKTRARRLATVWLFFVGYMALFWAADLGAFGWSVPEAVGLYGREFAILLSLIGLYLTANVPEILDREIELEELELNFDEELVEDTVEAFVGADDFESIRSQLQIMEGTVETPDGPIDVMSKDFNKVLPMRSIPGIGVRMEERLFKAGYKSAAQLAGETPQRLAAKVEGLSVKRAQKILRAARERVKEVFERMSHQSSSRSDR
ncbi:MAG: helix-hairpin-helix domain-containing protein [Candidatus Thorarchaeota archaeon]